MKQEELKTLAQQLSCPEGEAGLQVGINMNSLNQYITDKTLEALAAKAGECVVEIGPGNGALSEPMLNTLGEQGSYIGIELSDDMAQELSSRFANKACKVNIISKDCFEADISNNSVDALMAVNVLYFLEDLNAFFQHIKNWLKPGGRIVFGVRSDTALKKLPFTEYGFNIRSPEQICECLSQCGFQSLESNKYEEGEMPFGDMMVPVDSIVISATKL
jgi:cyclopropane fatty-acyl-phospholipid synthase-like methyltransferase